MMDPASLTRDEAQSQSRHCPRCQGGGLAHVYLRQYRGHRTAELDVLDRGEIVRRVIPAIVAAHCLCPLGRWMRSRIDDRELLSRWPDLADVLAGRSYWLADNPMGDSPCDVDSGHGGVVHAPGGRAGGEG